MKKYFSKYLFLIFLLSFFPIISFAQVSQIVFTTVEQSIKPDTLSSAITIQAQDSSGNQTQTTETLDLEFISTSPTGKFLNSSGNPATDYMSKNTANRTFYYKDSSEGAFTITVNAKGRDTGEDFSVSQQITISSGSSGSGDSNSSGSSSSSSGSSSSNSTKSNTNNSSANNQFDFSIGSDKTTFTGSPIWFQATIKKNTTLSSPELSWSFGDGDVGVGNLVSHSYKYAGDYIVVLSAKLGDTFYNARLKVKVLEPSISVSEKESYLEITNNSNNEINLFNWKIENKGKGFVFQPNTIILPHASLKLDKNLLRMKGLDNSQGISLKNFLGGEVFSVAPIKENLAVETLEKTDIKKIETAVYKKEETKAENTSILENATDTQNIIYEVPQKEGIFARLTNLVKRVFFK